MDSQHHQFQCSRCGTTVYGGERYCKVCGLNLEAAVSHPPVAPMNLGDIFNRLVQYIGRSFFRYITVAAVIFLPTTLLIILATTRFYGSIDFTNDYNDYETIPDFSAFFFNFGFIGLAGLVSFIAYLAGTVAVISIIKGEFSEKRIGWRIALTNAFSMYLLRAIGQVIVLLFIFGGAGFAMFVIVMIMGYITESLIITIPLFLGAVIFTMYLYYRLSFALPAIVCEDAGAFEGLSRSWKLVKGYWWRVFGILLLLGFMTEFATSIITTPVALIAMWPFYRAMFQAMGDEANEAEILTAGFESMGIGIGIMTAVYLVITVYISPIYTTILYYDLRARKGEFIPRETGQSAETGSNRP